MQNINLGLLINQSIEQKRYILHFIQGLNSSA